MSEIPPDVQAFLDRHPSLMPTERGKIRCELTGHEIPCRLSDLQTYTSGKKYKHLTKQVPSFDYSQYEPHVVPSTKQPNHLFCKLTIRHINRTPHDVLAHVNGKKYKRALQKYEQCVRDGVEFVPACLQNKQKRVGKKEEQEQEHERTKKKSTGFWEPTSSDREEESDDSMTDLYPEEMFPLKTSQDVEMKATECDDFQSDSDEEAASDKLNSSKKMEVEVSTQNKRKKKQLGSFQKRFKGQHRKGKGVKKAGKGKA